MTNYCDDPDRIDFTEDNQIPTEQEIDKHNSTSFLTSHWLWDNQWSNLGNDNGVYAGCVVFHNKTCWNSFLNYEKNSVAQNTEISF